MDAGRESWFSQQGYRCRLEWGHDAARRAAARGDDLVIVDTLRFSAAVATAVHHGAIIFPCRPDEDAHAPAARAGALVNAGAIAAAVSRVLERSTLQVTVVACGERWVLPSDDGPLRLAIEDGLGAGAILAALASRGHGLSPEARV